MAKMVERPMTCKVLVMDQRGIGFNLLLVVLRHKHPTPPHENLGHLEDGSRDWYWYLLKKKI